jgi:hypothetical protein
MRSTSFATSATAVASAFVLSATPIAHAEQPRSPDAPIAPIAPTVPSTPSAPAARVTGPEIVVTLTSGAVFRGEIIELVPGAHAVIRTAAGDIRRFEGREIVSIEKVGGAQPAGEATLPPLPNDVQAAHPPLPDGERPLGSASSATGAPAVPATRIVLRSTDSRATLYGRPEDAFRRPTGEWRPLCSAPCEHRVDDTWEFRIDGDGITASRPFRVGENRATTVVAKTTGSGKRTAGWTIVGVSAVGFAASIGMPVAAAAGGDSLSSGTFRALLWGGFATFVASFVAARIGFGLALDRTAVEIRVGADDATSGRRGTSSLRLAPGGFVF